MSLFFIVNSLVHKQCHIRYCGDSSHCFDYFHLHFIKCFYDSSDSMLSNVIDMSFLSIPKYNPYESSAHTLKPLLISILYQHYDDYDINPINSSSLFDYYYDFCSHLIFLLRNPSDI